MRRIRSKKGEGREPAFNILRRVAEYALGMVIEAGAIGFLSLLALLIVHVIKSIAK